MILCDIFSKDTKYANHLTDWYDFRCCFGFGENKVSGKKVQRLPLVLDNTAVKCLPVTRANFPRKIV